MGDRNSADTTAAVAGGDVYDDDANPAAKVDDGNGNGDEDGKVVVLDFLQDATNEMTWGRRIALGLMNQSWYNPRAHEKEEEEGEEDHDSCNNCNKEEDTTTMKRSEHEHEERATPSGNILAYDFATTVANESIEIEDAPDVAVEKDIAGTSEDEVCMDSGCFDKETAQGDDEKPDLRKGWAYFEHAALYRYRDEAGVDGNHGKKTKTKKKTKQKYELAEAGEQTVPTKLYSPFWTPHKKLGNFGLGIGLYFSTLRALIVITLCCGVLSLYNIIYFASDEYDSAQSYSQGTVKTLFLWGTAICSTTQWVPCPTCQCLKITKGFTKYGHFPPDRCAYGNDNEELLFVVKNDCDGTKWQLAATNFGVVVFMLIAIMFLGWYLRREEKEFSKHHLTAQNYSIQVTDPPSDAKDPEEWQRYFNEKCDGVQVTVCTCAVHNDLLVQTLVERRERIRYMQGIQPDISLDHIDLARISAEIWRERGFLQRLIAKIRPGIPEHFSRLVLLDMKVGGLAQLEYPVTNVFVTFETEQDQQHVLKLLMVGAARAKKNDPTVLSDPKYLFRGKHVLAVCEPMAPSDIRWTALNAGRTQRAKELSITTFITLFLIFATAGCVFLASNFAAKDKKYNDTTTIFGAAIIISICNQSFPRVAKLLTNAGESHPSESSRQGSLYYKIALFRWMNSTVVFFLIFPFTSTITDTTDGTGLIPKMAALFITNMVLSTFLALTDIGGHVRRHIMAPRKKTQDAMNICFQGSTYELAERYSDMTMILFMALFYSSIFPTAFFLCAINLTLKYGVDKFNLLRTWKIAPHIGPKVSKLSRLYFFPMAVVIMAIFCSYFWASFPFDNLCDTDVVNETYIGDFKLTPFDKATGSVYLNANETDLIVTTAPNDPLYSYCNQDFMAPSPYGFPTGFTFPFAGSPTQYYDSDYLDPASYMTPGQLTATTYFGWAAFAILILGLVKMLYTMFHHWKRTMYGRYWAPHRDLQGIPYSALETKSGYLPKANSNLFAYPLIACTVRGLDATLFDFKDSRRSHQFYDLTLDAKKLLSGSAVSSKEEKDDLLVPGFSVVKYWSASSGPKKIKEKTMMSF